MNSGGNVFNKLRSFAKTEQKRINRLKDKEEKVGVFFLYSFDINDISVFSYLRRRDSQLQATIETSVDAVTRLTLFKWINQGLFDRVEGIVATGKVLFCLLIFYL